MSLDIKFAFVCRRKFAELAGDSDLKRFCDTCKTEVINLDPLDDEARLMIFEDAAKTRIMPCVSCTNGTQGSFECAGSERSMGLTNLPQNIEAERVRIDQSRYLSDDSMEPARAQPSGPLSRLWTWLSALLHKQK